MNVIKQRGVLAAIAVLGLLITGQARANDFAASSLSQAKAEVNVSNSAVQVAEAFQLELTVVAPKGTKVSLPAIGDQLGQFDVLDTQDVADIPSDDSAGERIWTRRMTLESIVAGDFQVPGMEIQIANGTESKTLTSQPISVRVLSVLEGPCRPDSVSRHSIGCRRRYASTRILPLDLVGGRWNGNCVARSSGHRDCCSPQDMADTSPMGRTRAECNSILRSNASQRQRDR